MSIARTYLASSPKFELGLTRSSPWPNSEHIQITLVALFTNLIQTLWLHGLLEYMLCE